VTGEFKGFGFITMKSLAECQKAIDLPDKFLGKKEAVITLAVEKKNGETTKLFIGNVDMDVTENMIREKLRPCGMSYF
jgi:RNA recognition motif-containing protein